MKAKTRLVRQYTTRIAANWQEITSDWQKLVPAILGPRLHSVPRPIKRSPITTGRLFFGALGPGSTTPRSVCSRNSAPTLACATVIDSAARDGSIRETRRLRGTG